MWNRKCVQEEDGGRHYVYDFDQYYIDEMKNAPPRDDGRHSYAQCYSPSGNCYPGRDLPKYPYDPYHRPNAPPTKGVMNNFQVSKTPKINNDYMYDEQFQTFSDSQNQRNGNSSKCCGDTLPRMSSEWQCERKKVPGKAIRDHFCPLKNTTTNRNNKYCIVPSWLEINNDERHVKKCSDYYSDFNRMNEDEKKCIAKCYPKSVYHTKNSRRVEQKSFRPGASSEEKVSEFLGSYITKRPNESMDSYIKRCASAAKTEVQREHRIHVGIESNDNLDKYVKNLIVGTQLGQLAHGVRWSQDDCKSIENSLKVECQKLANDKKIDLNDHEFK